MHIASVYTPPIFIARGIDGEGEAMKLIGEVL